MAETRQQNAKDDLENQIDAQVAHRLPDIGRLVSLPHTMYTLLSLLMDEKTQPKDLERVLEQDPALAAKVISLSNSAFYGLTTPVSTIERAILIIGFKELEFMAMGLGLSETFDLSQIPKGFNGEELWLHSLSVSWIARELAVITKVCEPSEAMITGLLHELGVIILVSKFPQQFQQLLELTDAGVPFLDAEKSLGLSHAIIGYLLARNWNLPEVFQQGILYHHSPRTCPGRKEMAALVNLSDNLAHKAGNPMRLEDPEIDLAYALEVINLSPANLQNFVKVLMTSLPQVQPMWIQMMRAGARKPGPETKGRFSSLLSGGAAAGFHGRSSGK
ncbi:MAG: HDOD domain-containing protein [Deltaproteobacteria bacterium]|nr:HDOD domain-containing protein [Deltaproteobacteria bacterium]